MRLFGQFVIREQEVFACRVLTYLMHRSPELRDGTIRAINNCDGMNAYSLQMRQSFSIIPEWPTTAEDAPGERGRLDLLLETDNAVIGIEAKLTADLGPDQPQKYMDAIASHASRLSLLRNVEMRSVCVLLGPQSRQQMFLGAIARLPPNPDVAVCPLAWEQLFDEWRRTRATDPVTVFLADEIEHLVLTQTGRRADFDRMFHNLCSRLALARHDDHLEFLAWVYPAFRRTDMPYMRVQPTQPRKRADRTYLGYYFAGSQDKVWGWYGFVEPRFANDPDGKVPALVVGTDFEIENLDPKVFSPTTFTHPGFYAGARWWWRIKFDAGWNDLTRWQTALTPLREALERECELRKMAQTTTEQPECN